MKKTEQEKLDKIIDSVFDMSKRRIGSVPSPGCIIAFYFIAFYFDAVTTLDVNRAGRGRIRGC